MGALPPAPHWLPQDDFLLKNAAEAGASLQSLAKGAVQFSRRYTVQELQDRWNSLLYDPFVSERASSEMVQLECSFAISKLNRFENDKDVKSVSGKRRTESVRSCYYSMRKRVCNEAYPSMDMNFLTGSSNTSVPLLPDCVFEDSLADPFGDQQSGFDFIDNVFPDLEVAHENATGGVVDATFFAMEHNDHFINSINLPENVSATGLEVPVLNSPVSDCGKSFHTFGHSPSSQMPGWTPIEGTSPVLHNFQLPKEEPEMINDFTLPIDGIIQSEPNVEDQVPGDGGISTPIPDDLLAKIDSILNSSIEDDMFPMDYIGDEIINESYLDTYGSLLLDSPSAEQIANESFPLVSIAPDENLNIAQPQESAEKSQYHCGDRYVEVQMLSSALSVNPAYPELRNGVICCTLNTEDPDIPSNDDVFLPIRMPSTSSLPSMKQWKYDATFQSTSSSLRNSHTNNNGWSAPKKREQSNHEQSYMSSQKVELLQHSGMGLNRSASDCGVSYEVPNSGTGNAIRMNTSSNEGPKPVTSPRITTICALPVPAKETITQSDHAKNLNCNRDPQPVPLCLQKKTVTVKHELDSADTLQKNEPFCGEMVSPKATIPESSAEALLLEQEDLPGDSDEEDIPHFSDVEALILNMDLSPDDKDISFHKEVAKYQHQQTKRTIMRLEQGAEAHIQRVIAAQGAFAVLYSRHSTHFIKKPEVLLGRGTAETKVDIDLSGECCGNKVSRRQAIIKINEDGVFLLQNVSKHLIRVNGKEIVQNQSVHLTSNSLIEVWLACPNRG
ncbi:PREDICTED: uncharacterized protein LOC109152620 isoform X2 [Ipomoea nil]|uniref:uncharacterized protein LOC109152620 isoform X2 n=1 Tax=Ipomoea nil TaxID=35883 RepID=UPI0009010C54|nr:PREDICTED: uncharacterized protein LOC109152620 isoform X2 [Ipomoea nil]